MFDPYVHVYAGFTRFLFPLACRARSSISMYLSVIALELCPASSRTCSRGRCFSSSEIPVCRSQCTVASDGFQDEAEALSEATVHWLRHTGISEDVKHRPREHVRDDAGHSSSAITDKYIDIELRARHAS